MAAEHCHRINVSCLENKFFNTYAAAGDYYCTTTVDAIFLIAATTISAAVMRKNCRVFYNTLPSTEYFSCFERGRCCCFKVLLFYENIK